MPQRPPHAQATLVAQSLGKASKAWGKLTEPQRQAWCEAAKGVRSRPWMGKSKPLTGQAYFVKINARRLSDGQGLLQWPPAR